VFVIVVMVLVIVLPTSPPMYRNTGPSSRSQCSVLL
jgi:hypothetical protein